MALLLSQQLQIGTEGGEVIDVSVDSVAADKIGAYKRVDVANAAIAAATTGSTANTVTTSTEIVTINGATTSKTLAAPTAGDSAKAHAAAIITVSGETGVTAIAKTYAKFFTISSTNVLDADKTVSVKINDVTTGTFVF